MAAILVVDPNDSCSGTLRDESFAVGAPYTGPIFASGNGCKPFARDAAVTYVSVGEAIDLAQLDDR